MIIYIASPYTNYYDKQAAVSAQIDTFAKLRDLGHEPIAPLLSHYIDQRHPASYERWLQWCLAMVRVSDVLLRVGGESDGADREVAEARRLGKPVVHSIDEIAPYKFIYAGELHSHDFVADSVAAPGTYYEVTGDAPYKLTTGGVIDGKFSTAVSNINIGSTSATTFGNHPYTLTTADLLKDIADVPGMSYTWEEFQAANRQAKDDIADFVGVMRE